MNAYKFEYIWLDGYQPEANLIKPKFSVLNPLIRILRNFLTGLSMGVQQCRPMVVHLTVF